MHLIKNSMLGLLHFNCSKVDVNLTKLGIKLFIITLSVSIIDFSSSLSLGYS